MSHQQINSISSPVLEHMQRGYKFFTTWLESLLAEGMYNVFYLEWTKCYYNMVSSSNLPFDFASTLIYNLHLSRYFPFNRIDRN